MARRGEGAGVDGEQQSGLNGLLGAFRAVEEFGAAGEQASRAFLTAFSELFGWCAAQLGTYTSPEEFAKQLGGRIGAGTIRRYANNTGGSLPRPENLKVILDELRIADPSPLRSVVVSARNRAAKPQTRTAGKQEPVEAADEGPLSAGGGDSGAERSDSEAERSDSDAEQVVSDAERSNGTAEPLALGGDQQRLDAALTGVADQVEQWASSLHWRILLRDHFPQRRFW